MLLLDITELRVKCKELQQGSLVDIDTYLAEELLLKKYGHSKVIIDVVNQSAIDLFGFVGNVALFRSKSHLFDSLYENIKQLIVNEIFYEKRSIVYEYSGDEFIGKNIKYKVYIDFIEFDGRCMASVSIFDISYYKKSELILTEFVEKYYLLLKTVKDAILIVDINDGKILEVNDRSVDLFKIGMSDLVGSAIVSYFTGGQRDKFNNFFKNIVNDDHDGDETIHAILTTVVGEIPVQIRIAVALVGNVRVAQVLLHDMRNRFEMEERKRLLATAVEQAAESVIITDPSGNIQYVNPAFEDVSGYSFTEMLGKNPRILQSGETPAYLYKLMWREIAKGKVWRGMFVNRKKNGEIFKEYATITPVKDNNDNIINYVAVKRDVTQHLLLENQIRQSQKMQAIGTLAGGVAHDFNNILTAIMGYAELSQSQCDKGTLLYNNLVEIIRGADRAGQLVDQILKFSRQSEKNVSSLKLSLIIKEAIRLLRASLPANTDLLFEAADDFYVKADPTQMHQVVMNLCTNAYQALEGRGGVISLRLFRKNLSPKEGVVTGNLPQGAYVCLQVADNGIGIPPAYLQRIFEPYFTTKNLHEGTGLGLSVVHGIVNDHRGAITVDSTPGHGSTFTVYLPEAEEMTEKKVSKGGLIRSAAAGHILVVDDEKPITSFLTQILEHLGYKAEACVSSEAAYALFLERKGGFDLVITDMGMPGMSGLELAEKLKKIKPTIPIMLCTGFSEQVTAENYRQMGLAGFVPKPFNARHIAQEVARVMKGTKKQQ